MAVTARTRPVELHGLPHVEAILRQQLERVHAQPAESGARRSTTHSEQDTFRQKLPYQSRAAASQ